MAQQQALAHTNNGGEAVAVPDVRQIVTPVGEAAALIAMIERAAADPSVDIDKMERLFAMHKEVVQRQAMAAFNAAMANAQAELVPVAKNARNNQTNSNYADLGAIADVAMPVVHSHGFGLSFGEFKSQEPGCMGVVCEVTHANGHGKTYHFNVPLDGAGLRGAANKTATHAYGSTFTYGRRYATLAVFNIAIKNDNDGNGKNQPQQAYASPATITPEQAEELSKLITDTGSDIDKFLAMGKVQSLSDIRATDFDGAKSMLLAKLRKRAESKQPQANGAAA